MDLVEMLAEILRLGQLKVLDHRFTQREARLWLVERGDECAVLRRLDPGGPPTGIALFDDRTWQHRFLTQLAGTGMNVPVPIRAFSGSSIIEDDDGAVWELLSFLRGVEIGWSPRPTMFEIGAFLGRLHDAASMLPSRKQRPGAVPLKAVPAILTGALSEQVTSPIVDLYGVLAAEFDDALREIGHEAQPTIVIHGDFTNHNVIADGDPICPVGVIDFGLSHVEAAVADIGYGLWRSGRPHQEAAFIDATRTTEFVRGYASIRPLTRDERAAVPIYVLGRGLQMLAKRLPTGLIGGPMLDQVLWLRKNHASLGHDLVRAGYTS